MTTSLAEHTRLSTPAPAQPQASYSAAPAPRLTPYSATWDPIINTPNVVTLVRTLAAVAVTGVAIHRAVPWLLAVAYAIYWIGDILDGWLARRLDQETRLGAVFDIVSDRACTSILCIGVMVAYPAFAVVVVAFFLSFMVLDTVLSLAFLCWPVLSPNHFGRVDRVVYLLNWSPLAKSLNTAGVIVLAVAGLVWVALGLVAVLVGVKVWSVVRVQSLLRSPVEVSP